MHRITPRLFQTTHVLPSRRRVLLESSMDHPANIAVYTDYDSPIPHPGEGWTRFVCISDTHSRKPVLPLGDVLLHAGDLSRWGYPEELHDMAAWLQGLPHPVKM